MAIKLITFDLDNTLWETDQVIHQADQACLRWLCEQVPAYRDISKEEFQSIGLEVVASIKDFAHDVSKVRVAYMEAALRHLRLPEGEVRQLAAGAFEVFRMHRNRVKIYPDVAQVLGDLQRRFVLGTLTNGNADVSKTELAPFFAFNLSAADVGTSKPEPQMFDAALNHVGCAGQEAIHVGDQPIDDVAGAYAVGFHTIWVNYEGTKSLKYADATIHRFDDLEIAIDSIATRISRQR